MNTIIKAAVIMGLEENWDSEAREWKKELAYKLLPPGRYLYEDEVKLFEVEVPVEIPEMSYADFSEKMIATLREKQQKAREDVEKEIAELEEKIKEYQLLTYNPQDDSTIVAEQ